MATDRQIFFDTETVGLEPVSGGIIELAAIEVIARRPGRTFQSYIKPTHKVSPGAQAIHGISDEQLADKLHGTPTCAGSGAEVDRR